ncbi:MAG: DUF445 domain-containing protein [Oceanospirillaceae bacterium]|nr:DUF445 domain-containing protein [Oceanospirillaceae bacterium]
MNKSVCTNLVALIVMLVAIVSNNDTLYFVGVFALSGALTNWLAIYMLFEKVPGLYGSGVIPEHFEEFKVGIKEMMMEQFFSSENIEKFMHSEVEEIELKLEPIIEQLDFSSTYDGLIEVIEQSSFGAMLEMVGGTKVIEPMREPFVARIKSSIIDVTRSEQFKSLMSKELEQGSNVDLMVEKVESIVEQRLAELSPALVKEIVQKMIKKHLGWLVVWGGVFGGAIGALASIWG